MVKEQVPENKKKEHTIKEEAADGTTHPSLFRTCSGKARVTK